MSPTDRRTKVLVIDDEPDVRALVRVLLERAGHEVVEAANGREGLRRLHALRPNLIMLDVTMPELDGWQTLERVRDLTDAPVIMLTAQATELSKVRGLQRGADDYVVKPFGRQELLARVEALLRRSPRTPEVRETYADERIAIDFANRQATVDGAPVTLTPLEFKLLVAFVRHPNQVLSRDQILQHVWGDADSVSSDQVKLYVGYLRRKLDADGRPPVPVETVRGFGYRYSPGGIEA